MTCSVYSIRCWWGRTAPDWWTACCVCNIHSVTKQLCNKLSIRSFATACTRTWEFKVRHSELTSLNCWKFKFVKNFLLFSKCYKIVVFFLFVKLLFKRLHNKSRVFFACVVNRTYISTAAAACTVKNCNSHCIVKTVKHHSVCILDTFRSIVKFLFSQNYRTDTSVRTYIWTAAALNTSFVIPYRNVDCNTSLFKRWRTKRNFTCLISFKCWNRKLHTAELVNRNKNIVHVVDKLAFAFVLNRKVFRLSIFPACRYFNFNNLLSACINSVVVHLYNSVTLLWVWCCCSVLHILDSVGFWKNTWQFKECRL